MGSTNSKVMDVKLFDLEKLKYRLVKSGVIMIITTFVSALSKWRAMVCEGIGKFFSLIWTNEK